MSSLLVFGLRPPPVAVASATNLKEAVVAALTNEPNLTAILGTRVYPGQVPQSATLPAMAYLIERSEHETDLAGAAGMTWSQLRFEVLSQNVRDCETVKEVVRNLFVGFRGTLGPILVEAVKFERERDRYIAPLPGSDKGTHSKQFDLRFKTPESIPTNT